MKHIALPVSHVVPVYPDPVHVHALSAQAAPFIHGLLPQSTREKGKKAQIVMIYLFWFNRKRYHQ